MRRRARALLVAVVLASASSCSKSPPPEPAETRVDEPEFKLTLPGGWIEKKGYGDYTLSDPKRNRTVTVGLLSIPGEDPRSLVDRMVENRRAQTQQTNPGMKLTRPAPEESGGTLRVRFHGVDQASGTLVWFLFVAAPKQVFGLAYYEYGNPSEAEAAARADAVFASFVPK